MYELKDNKKASDSQKKIYKGLRRILLVKPLNKVTVADIKKECCISRSTFYRNFNNVTDILTVIFEYFYSRFLSLKDDKSDKLLFFFEYWYWHRDLVAILAAQNIGIIEDCMKRHDSSLSEKPYLLAVKLSLFSSILSKWSESKAEMPEQMTVLTRSMMNSKCISVLLD